jgi:hypothetical protein
MADVDPVARTFRIDRLLVDYGSANIDDIPGGVPTLGRLLEVEDANLSYVAGSGRLTATKLEPAGKVQAAQMRGREVEIESLVTAVDEPGARFRISGFAVNLNASTQFRYGDAQDIGVGALLQVRGRVNQAGEIDARRITFKRSGARIAARTESAVDLDNGEVDLLGVRVRVTERTEMRDERDDRPGFGIGDIRIGDFIEVSGFLCGDNRLCARRLEREQNRNRTELRGVAANPDPVALRVRIQGLMVQADTNTRFRGPGDRPLSSDEFFSAITPGLTVLEAEWEPAVGAGEVSVTAPSEIEIEDDYSAGKLEDDSPDHGGSESGDDSGREGSDDDVS